MVCANQSVAVHLLMSWLASKVQEWLGTHARLSHVGQRRRLAVASGASEARLRQNFSRGVRRHGLCRGGPSGYFGLFSVLGGAGGRHDDLKEVLTANREVIRSMQAHRQKRLTNYYGSTSPAVGDAFFLFSFSFCCAPCDDGPFLAFHQRHTYNGRKDKLRTCLKLIAARRSSPQHTNCRFQRQQRTCGDQRCLRADARRQR